ncbi:FAD-binding oxidoreductase [Streptomyces sp. A3M-1-3]|uniref:FAD-binding oxidoreductase n=1 Tax=Streptomyces sp. A3M-1-3 TaxID=2962044 RepID=UPI0020B63E31|nr:FAD-binding oxidoreductase [Streptomyces sp. A3M-1-3]MCP3822796.1 FAD-binding oxidoreductase [Streptomyces sp. A3M-1-3]
MTGYSRRTFVRNTAATVGVALAPPVLGEGVAVAVGAAGEEGVAETGALRVGPSDARYQGLASGVNLRWVGTPDHVRVVGSTDQVVQAVQEAVDRGQRIAVRSGGHCYEDFVTHADVRVVIDMSGMTGVFYDRERQAFAVEPGALLGTVYRSLYKGWGVTIPGGTCPTVGAGGHIAGGGYGPLSRLHGLTVDHLYAVEVVVVDADGNARKVVATREASDPNRDLWWAHTGAGGGNFGVITRYWLRSPNATGTDPSAMLPQPPAELLVSDISWSWSGMTEQSFTRLLKNFSRWHEKNSGADSVYAGLFSHLKPQHRSAGAFSMSTQIDASLPGAEGLLDDFLTAVNAGTGLTYQVNDRKKVPWLYAVTQWSGWVGGATARWKAKSAYLRRAFPDAQLKAFYRHMTRTDYDNPGGIVVLAGFGGRVNSVGASETAVPQRDSIIKMLYVSLWANPDEDAKHLQWIREFYRDVYGATGGVPRPDGVNDGCFINYVDADMADPSINDSGVPWHQLYFKDGYRRLQRVKGKWDPRGIFTHSMAIRNP